MNLIEYQVKSAGTDKKTLMRNMRLLYYAGQLANEAAELRGKVWKTYRDRENYQDQAIAEAGDVLWYITQIATFCEVRIIEHTVDGAEQYVGERSDSVIDDVMSLNSRCNQLLNIVYAQSLVEMHHGDLGANDRLAAKDIVQLRLIGDVMIKVQCCCHHLGTIIENVAEDNYIKLNGRKDRNMIEGSGDNR